LVEHNQIIDKIDHYTKMDIFSIDIDVAKFYQRVMILTAFLYSFSLYHLWNHIHIHEHPILWAVPTSVFITTLLYWGSFKNDWKRYRDIFCVGLGLIAMFYVAFTHCICLTSKQVFVFFYISALFFYYIGINVAQTHYAIFWQVLLHAFAHLGNISIILCLSNKRTS
jgi:hypothetical protein